MPNRKYSTIELFFRSLIFSIYSLTSMCLYSFLVVFAFFMSLSARHKLIRVYLSAYIKVLEKVCLITYQVEGLENIPADRAGVILSKHQSAWETFFLPLIFHEPAIILKRELMWLPFFGWGLAAADPIAINRNDKSSAMQQILTKGKKCLDSGRWVLVFPEGTRVPYGQVGHYRLGGPRLAAATGYPVIPVAHNAGKFWPKRKFIKQPGMVTVVIGPLIESTGLDPEEILKKTKTWIEDTMLKL